MKKATYLILGSCLMLQAAPASRMGASAWARMRSPASSGGNMPLYHHEQAKELLGLDDFFFDFDEGENSERVALDLTLFINARTREFLPEAWRTRADQIAETLLETADRYQMDPIFLMALIRHESRFNPSALGSHGEVGLMQIKPSTAAWLINEGDMIEFESEGLDEALKDPETNIKFGTAYLAKLRSTFKGRGPLYLAAYNMGAVNLKNRLRAGVRPRIYSDLVLGEYIALSLDFSGRTNPVEHAVASQSAWTFGPQ